MDSIGPLQLRVMKFIWKNGPSTVNQVHEALNSEKGAQQLAYTTILTVMRNLAKRGMLDQQTGRRSHVFTPLVDQPAYTSAMLSALRRDLFDNDIKKMVQFMANDKGISPAGRKRIAKAL